jgi:hypothetical protein
LKVDVSWAAVCSAAPAICRMGYLVQDDMYLWVTLYKLCRQMVHKDAWNKVTPRAVVVHSLLIRSFIVAVPPLRLQLPKPSPPIQVRLAAPTPSLLASSPSSSISPSLCSCCLLFPLPHTPEIPLARIKAACLQGPRRNHGQGALPSNLPFASF